MYESLYVLVVVGLVASAEWVWFRRRTDSLVADLEGQITLLKLKIQDVEEELNTLRIDLKEKGVPDPQNPSGFNI